MAIVSTIIFVMKLSHQAGLNIGITISIWAINPFFVALVEKIRFNNSLTCSQFLGMLALTVMAVMVSLSDVFNPDAEVIIQ